MSNDLTLVDYEGMPVPIDHSGLPWLTQKQLSDLLGVNQSTVSRNIEHAANAKLVVESSEKRNLPIYASSAYKADNGQTYHLTYYNVYVLIYLAMRTNSERAHNFQMWAMEKLADALVGELREKITYLESELSSEANARRSAEMKTEWLETKEQMRTRIKDSQYEDYED